jgi:hypothetical protein
MQLFLHVRVFRESNDADKPEVRLDSSGVDKPLLFVLTLLFLGSIADPGVASARDSLHASIAVHGDSLVTITETIRIESGNDWFSNEVDRNLPTARRKLFGLKYSKGFQLLECLRDEEPETCKVFGDKGLMIRVGDFMNRAAVPQVRTYTLKYRLDNQIISTSGGDRFTWTVTEKYWGWWPINVSASVSLPGDASAHLKDNRILMGPEGKEEIILPGGQVNNDGVVCFAAPRALNQNEGFSISLTWPKGYLKPPGGSAVILQLAADNRGILIGLGGTAILLAYYVMAWMIAGRGPAKGTIVVRYGPPQGMSPAVMRYIWKMGYDDRCFAAALLNMAAKGHLTIRENQDKQYIVGRTKGNIPLSADEMKIMDQLLPNASDVTLEMEEHRLSAAVGALTEYLRVHFEKVFFIGNLRYFGVGLFISAVMVVATGLEYLTDPIEKIFYVVASLMLTMGSPPVIVAALEFLKRWKSALAPGGAKGVRIAKAVIFTVAAALISRYCFGALSMMIDMTSPYIIVFIGAAVAVNYAFYEFMKAPTRAGGKLRDEIEGFREFLRMTEEDRMKRLEIPDRTPELFTTYLPYALALDLEQKWSEQFSNLLGGAALGELGSSLALTQGNIVTLMGTLLRSR